MPLYRHPTLTVLRVSPAASGFLKQYTTHLIDAPQAAFLTREGRLVAAVRQAKISDEEALLVVEQAYQDRLLAHLAKYLALSDTKIGPAPEFVVYFEPLLDGHDDGGATRQAAPAADILIPEKSGRWLISSDHSKASTMTEQDYTRFRVEHGIPEQGTDFTDEIPLCIDPSWVHFDKGCYLGQEIVARVHYRGTPPKRLVVKKVSDCSPGESARLTSKIDTAGGVAGFVFV